MKHESCNKIEKMAKCVLSFICPACPAEQPKDQSIEQE